ncbi:YppE family protein [Robertmurraya massiliosenegalensis]|uniref:YppE family protein n=1 Tax=Robertmurraya massiliosenegalensis TaxID=1287657 RepID=UPI0002E3B539|nr:YppE family protein [Robertmurraya massiliosenegalensis]
MNETLLELTEKLLAYIEQISDKFEEVKETKVKGDFFLEVKPFADEVNGVKEEWHHLAVKWIEENKPKYLHVKQIESTSEQMELLSVQAFFPDTSRTRFINYWQSARFILTSLKDLLKGS